MKVPKQLPFSAVVISLVIAVITAFSLGAYVEEHGLLSKISIRKDQAATNTELPDDLDYSSVERVYDKLKANFEGDLDEQLLLDGLKTGLVASSGDPYTVYLNTDQAREFEESLNGEFTGIGIEVAIKNDQFVVVAPIPDTPAARAGLRAGDQVLAINDENTAGMSMEVAISKIRGPEGTNVKLTILRDKEDPREVTITRAHIVVPNVTSKILEGNIGYIKLSTFGNTSAAETAKIANDFAAQGVKGVILDLRNNSGGLLDASVDISGLWLDNQLVVEQRGGGKTDALKSGRRGVLYGVPTVVLINEGSASASEIVAGALQDHGVAKVVGEKSFGKGSVQGLEELGGGAQLKVTIARWYTPKGKNIDKEGIKPDVEVKLTEDDFNSSRDPQLDKAIELLKQ